MSLINISIPNLVNGVSQQPAVQRLLSQGALQENCHSSVVEGLKDRAPTHSIAKLINGQLADAYAHTINRDTTERYVVIVTDGMIRVFDLAGVEKTVNSEDDTYTILSGAAGVVNGATFPIYPATGETAVDFTVSGITTATVKLQMSTDGAAWTDVDTRTTNGTTAGILISGRVYLRAIVSAWTSGTISCTVTYKTFKYLGATTPSQSFRCLTVADHTFIVNTTKTAAMGTTTSAAAVSEALVYVKQGNYSIRYEIFVDGVSKAVKTTSDTTISDIRTDVIAADLATALVANLGAGWTVNRLGSTIQIKKDNGTAFECKATDSNGDRNMVLVKGSIQNFSDLPNTAPAGFSVKVAGDAESNKDDYWVSFVTNNSGATFDRGTWKESLAPGTVLGFDALTMPHLLVRESNGTFTFKKATWDSRAVGDADSVPDPSFVGQKIADLFFYRNRLGFLADQNYILSRAGEYFNFWPTTVTAILDSDPIDVTASHTKVSLLRHAVSVSKKLLLFSDQTQFVISGGDLLTPKTVGSDVTTEFENSKRCRPVPAGKNIYFATKKGRFTGFREYFVDRDTDTDDAADVTAHVPAYVPDNVFKIATATNEDILVVLTEDERNAAYVYKFYWAGTDKLQSSWSKWPFGGAETKVLNGDFINTDLYLVMQREDGVYLEVMSVEPERKDTDMDYEVLLDRRIDNTKCTSVVYDAATDKTTWTLPYAESSTMMVVTRPGGAKPVGVVVSITRPSATTARATGDWTAQPVYLGRVYTRRYRFSTPVLKQKSEKGSESVLAGGRIQVLRYTLTYDRSGYFRTEVTPTYGVTSIKKFTGRILGSGNNVIGESALESGTFSFPVLSKNDRCTIDIVNDSFLPMRIQSAEWVAQYVPKAQRV